MYFLVIFQKILNKMKNENKTIVMAKTPITAWDVESLLIG